jgi:hypothetical protein
MIQQILMIKTNPKRNLKIITTAMVMTMTAPTTMAMKPQTTVARMEVMREGAMVNNHVSCLRYYMRRTVCGAGHSTAEPNADAGPVVSRMVSTLAHSGHILQSLSGKSTSMPYKCPRASCLSLAVTALCRAGQSFFAVEGLPESAGNGGSGRRVRRAGPARRGIPLSGGHNAAFPDRAPACDRRSVVASVLPCRDGRNAADTPPIMLRDVALTQFAERPDDQSPGLRISLRRAPRARWASRAELDGGVLTVRY